LANIGTRREDGKRVHCIFSKNLVGPREKKCEISRMKSQIMAVIFWQSIFGSQFLAVNFWQSIFDGQIY
jgi:hypothetical protein